MTAAPRAVPSTPLVAAIRARAVALLAVLTVLLLAAGTGPARAHDGLVATSPGADAAVAAPREVELEFTGTPLPLGTQVVVTGPDSASVSAGDAEIRGTSVVQALADELAAGSYTVQWRSTSSDGHALSGTFGFTVAPGPAADAGTGSAAAAPSDAAAAGDDAVAGADPAGVGSDPAQPQAAADRAAGDGLAVGWLGAGALLVGAVALLVRGRLRRRA
ncbi:copper resistance CopC family protein [Modestobacter italicus]|uniref:copper resistance CopC family protein n=1 Tax=Modestobacter italicus (strain DSM 44449 / CECT 9708 / BC 501) TaxID=2732864 RepID=UPI001C95C725|nr:copper resistance CopC family protein [Modestobacter italicus]